MKAIFIPIAILLWVLSVAAERPPVQKIELSTKSGVFPLNVSIIGPSAVVDHLKNCDKQKFKGGNNGISLDWGDGSKVSSTASTFKGRGCAEVLTHSYSRMGEYKISLSLSHPGPKDGVETEWIGEATVTVTAAP